MCGIVAYVGSKVVQPLLIEGLRRMEYRGYDSAGIAVIDDKGQMHLRKAVGRISVLENKLDNSAALPIAHTGMAHTPHVFRSRSVRSRPMHGEPFHIHSARRLRGPPR